MPYISTDLNRVYVALESSYGAVPAPSPSHAFRALKQDIELSQDYLERQDKTGSRSFAGIGLGGRRHGKFNVQAYLTPSGTAGSAPNMGPVFQAARGRPPGGLSAGPPPPS